MRFLAASALLALAAFAPAQTPKIERPLYLEVGAFFPDYRGADFGHDLGVSAGLGYSFYQKEGFRLSGELRGAYHLATLGGGGAFGTNDSDEGNLTIGSALANVRYRHGTSPLFAGLSLGVGHASIEDGDDRSAAIFAAEVGYDLSSRVYVAARYQTASEDSLRGANLSLGFRF